jgi:hypothetical protein
MDHFLLGRLVTIEHRHLLTQAQDGDSIGDLEHVMKVVGNDHNPEIPLGKAPHKFQHLLGLSDTKGSRRFIEDDQLRVPHDRFRNGNGLTLSTGKATDSLTHGLKGGDGQAVERVSSGTLHGALVEHEPTLRPFPPEIHVRNDIQVVRQSEVLVNDFDAEGSRLSGAVDADGLALESHLAVIEWVDACNALDESRLAGPVVADQGHDLASAHLEVDIIQGVNLREGLRYTYTFQ